MQIRLCCIHMTIYLTDITTHNITILVIQKTENSRYIPYFTDNTIHNTRLHIGLHPGNGKPPLHSTYFTDITTQHNFKVDTRLKGTISYRPFQTSLFSKPLDLFLHIRRELQCNNLPIQQLLRKQHLFGKRDNSLLLGMYYRRR